MSKFFYLILIGSLFSMNTMASERKAIGEDHFSSNPNSLKGTIKEEIYYSPKRDFAIKTPKLNGSTKVLFFYDTAYSKSKEAEDVYFELLNQTTGVEDFYGVCWTPLSSIAGKDFHKMSKNRWIKNNSDALPSYLLTTLSGTLQLAAKPDCFNLTVNGHRAFRCMIRTKKTKQMPAFNLIGTAIVFEHHLALINAGYVVTENTKEPVLSSAKLYQYNDFQNSLKSL